LQSTVESARLTPLFCFSLFFFPAFLVNFTVSKVTANQTMSEEFNWLLLQKTNNSFVVKRKATGVEFTTEPRNLTAVNSFKYSGLIRKKTVNVSTGSKGRGAKLSIAKTRVAANKLGKRMHHVTLPRAGPRHAAKAVVGQIAQYRSDLARASLGKLTAVLQSQRKPKVRSIKNKGRRGSKQTTVKAIRV